MLNMCFCIFSMFIRTALPDFVSLAAEQMICQYGVRCMYMLEMCH